MSDPTHNGNGYVRLPTLVAVAAPVLGFLCAAVAIYVTMSISPIRDEQARQREDIRDIRVDVVPRKEHEKDWLRQAQKDASQDEKVEGLSKDFKDLYSPSDAIKDMRRDIDELKGRVAEKPRP